VAHEFEIAPVAGSGTDAQTITATAASTAEQAITGNSDGGAVYVFVAAGYAHLAFGVTGLGAADTGDILITPHPRELRIDPQLITHVRAIRNGAADVVVSFKRKK